VTRPRRHAAIDVHHDGELAQDHFERASTGSPVVRLVVDLTQDRQLVNRLIDQALDAAYDKPEQEQDDRPKRSRELRRLPQPLRLPVSRRSRKKKGRP
jgi:hypothetical protein